LPGLALTCLATTAGAGCLDDDPSLDHAAGAGEPVLDVVVVADPVTSALPPKPALARFATATKLGRARVLDAALARDANDVVLTAVGQALAPPRCPGADRRGDVVWSNPDCVDEAGVHHSGRLIARSGGADDTLRIELSRWRADAPGTRDDIAYEGTVVVHPDGRLETNLVVAAGAELSHTYATWRWSHEQLVAEPGSWVILRDIGIADIGGAWRLAAGDRPYGQLALTGADELRLDLDGAADDCATVTLDGEVVGQRCDLAALARTLVVP
jgi:hypothetical protein